MSFGFTFAARDVSSARRQLQETFAPMAVKALVELALASVPAPRPASPGTSSDEAFTAGGNPRIATERKPDILGILIEVSGHIDECGGKSSLERFIVRPLYD